MAGMLSSRTLTHDLASTAVPPTPEPGLPTQRFLTDALQRALAGRAVLVCDADATSPDALRMSTAHIELLLVRLAALEPPAPAGRQAA
jgi:hypothetical protein